MNNIDFEKSDVKINFKKFIKFSIYFILVVILFIFSMLILIIFGPFQNVRTTIIGSSITTMKHQYIAKIFFDDDTIKNILEKNKFNDSKMNIDLFNKKFNIKNNSIQKYSIKSKRFNGIAIIIENPNKVKIGYSNKINFKGETTSEIAKRYDAIAAINGGGFLYDKKSNLWSSNGSKPSGFIICDNKIIYKDKNIDMYEKTNAVGLNKNGVLIVGKYSLNDLKKLDVRDAVSFGPVLVKNGSGVIIEGDGGWGIAPRTAIGQKKDGSIIFLVIDGRQSKSYGASLKDIQNIMLKLGAYTACNLDGGSSSTMYYNGKVLNNPSNPLGEKAIPSIIYVER